ncbi:hypothetical protein AGMMS49942_21210 [Spirochaetia bacterium]|nr:hypothetical protein AGMMS49942_21210 [Spirochaetia bacterium]
MNRIKVEVCGFDKLFGNNISTKIPEYQRSYTWGIEKAEELLNDFIEFFINLKSKENYYLGSVLLHNNNNELEIIDGQQRITTLLIMKYILKDDLSKDEKIKFNTIKSIKYIKEVQTYFEKNCESIYKLEKYNFFDRLEFTKITTSSADDAFSFFDTQNNRGIKLSPTDYLKAYHLRAIVNFEKSDELQEKKATSWERIGKQDTEPSLLDYLFERILWRARNWRGSNIGFENQDLLLVCFQKQTKKSQKSNSYPFYKSKNNLKYESVNWSDEKSCKLIVNNSQLKSTINLPFSLRQPIHEGLNFFDYTEKYATIYEMLFESRPSNNAMSKMRTFYDGIYDQDMSIFLRDFIKLLLVSFYDSFGEFYIDKAINHFDYIIGAMRIKLSKIKKESITKYLKENPVNFIDLITNAYTPEEVFVGIRTQENIEQIYLDVVVDPDGTGVQARYVNRVASHFHVDTLKDRKSWLDQ